MKEIEKMAEKKRKRKLPPRMHKKGDTYYYVTSLPNRKRNWESLGKDERLALERYRLLHNGVPAPNTTRYIIEDFLDNMRDLAPSTQTQYRKRSKKLILAFGHLRPAAVDPGLVAEYLERRKSKRQGNLGVKLLSLVFRRAVRLRLVARNPCRDVELNKVKKRDKLVTN